VSLENLAGVFLSRHKQVGIMDIITGNIKKIYLHYLFTGFGSAIITSIYSTVDMVVSGQYEGPLGAAALSVISPLWSLFISIGLLAGIGGAVLMSVQRGGGYEAQSKEIFTISLFSGITISIVLTVLLSLFREEFLRLCGADAEVLPYALYYTKWVIIAIPFFIVGVLLSAFIRNDNAPFLVMLSVIFGGVLNIFGDVFFVFTCNMGIEGAGLATMLGQAAAFIVLCTHFFNKKCKLRVVRPKRITNKLIQIISMGFSPFIVDLSFGFVVFCFPETILRIFMHTTGEILRVGPEIVRTYSFAYLLMGMNIISSYYLQALKQSKNAFIISLLRGFVIYLILVFLLPAIAGFNAIWLTIPLTEFLTLFFMLKLLKKEGNRNA
jgi:Na+-driven multidrug efflux pump